MRSGFPNYARKSDGQGKQHPLETAPVVAGFHFASRDKILGLFARQVFPPLLVETNRETCREGDETNKLKLPGGSCLQPTSFWHVGTSFLLVRGDSNIPGCSAGPDLPNC